MSNKAHGWLTGWGTLIGGVATLGIMLVAYLTYRTHLHDKPGQQEFSVSINSAPQSTPDGVTRQMKDSVLNFQVRKCAIAAKLVSCSLTVTSPKYDRRVTLAGTKLVDDDGDIYQASNSYQLLNLERDQSATFKLEFAVTKNISLPATVELNGLLDSERFSHNFKVK